MKQLPPHGSHAGVGHVALLVLTVALFLAFVMSMTGPGPGARDPLGRPQEVPAGLGL